MVILNLKQGMSIQELFNELSIKGFQLKEGKKWSSQRFTETEFNIIKCLIGYLNNSIILPVDRTILAEFQDVLIKNGVNCINSLANNDMNYTVIWRCFN